jgi:hypothetical protein
MPHYWLPLILRGFGKFCWKTNGNLKKSSLFWFSMPEYTFEARDAMFIYREGVGGR